jgi:uncharacterized delta-60 repeat protein
VARFNGDGTADTSFGTSGTVTTDLASGSADQANAAVQEGDKIVVAGSSNGKFALAAYNSDGSLDTSFGTGGEVITPIGSSATDTVTGLAQQADGKLLVTGTSGTPGQFATARFLGEPTTSSASGVLQFDATGYRVNENAGTVAITVTRTGGSAGTVTVQYATADGTAVAGTNYTATSNTLTFGPGETSKTFNIAVRDDGVFGPDKTVTLSLSTPGGGATLGSPATAVLTIVNVDSAQPSQLQFSAAASSVAEKAGSATITVTRSGGSDGTVTVQYATADGTAHAGVNYTAVSGPLTFGPGETSKTFTIPILDDGLAEPNGLTVALSLTQAGGGAVLGSPSHT